MSAVYTKREAAQLLKCAPITIDRARRAGRLSCRKIGAKVVFTQDDLDAFLRSCAVPAKAAANE